MRVARFYKAGEGLRLEEAEKPVATFGTAIVRMRAAGVCGTELHFLKGMVNVRKPLILGHEMAGEIESVNNAGSFKPGDRVVIYTMINCGYCSYCRSGMESICENRTEQIGFSRDGGFAEYVRVPAANLVPLPPEVSFQDAAVLACSGMTSIHALRLSGLGLGQKVVVNGVGGVGIIAIQICRLAGGRVIAVTDNEVRAKLASKLGAEHVVCSNNYADVPRQIKEFTGVRGAEFYMDFVGTSDSVNAGLDSLARRGKLVIIGYTAQELVIDPSRLVHSELQILSSLAASKQDLEDVIDMAKRKLVAPVIDNEYDLEDINLALEKLQKREVLGRSVIVFP